MSATEIHRKLERLADDTTGVSLNHLAEIVDTQLGCIVEEMRRINPNETTSGSEKTAADQDFKQACEFLACGVDPNGLGFVHTHRWTPAFHEAGCRTLGDITKVDLAHISTHWAQMPSPPTHLPSPQSLNFLRIAARHINAEHVGGHKA